MEGYFHDPMLDSADSDMEPISWGAKITELVCARCWGNSVLFRAGELEQHAFTLILVVFHDLQDLVLNLEKRIHHPGFEMLAPFLPDDLMRLLYGEGLFIGTSRGQRVEHIRQSDDP